MEIEFIIQLSLLGVVVGFAAGLLGVGGGVILVPMLTSMFLSANIVPSHAVHLALGTSMACIITTTFSSAFSHYKNHNVDWPHVKAMVPFIVIGALCISFLIPIINTTFLAVFFSLFITSLAIKLFVNQAPSTSKLPNRLPPQLAGLGIGSISTLVAIGGAAFTVPYLLSRRLALRTAIGSAATIGFPIAIAGTIGYGINGQISPLELANNDNIIGFIHIPSVIIISASGFFMAPIGVKMSNKLPIAILKKIFAILLVCLSVKMLMNVVL
ncbi:sulfite exporter TauE/SafE family protein [uncultured Paraglaciecola sp.]|uniref:sulfite exporter TauE/SafE family protein n=1 Tax=uncultured Paraglaciecola sp. TaxID=1765024 RepID=UPI0026181F3E|nr:sulfite exporter TauE/SafE family protein [uncultured Paraglaciecola sp.]